MWNTFMSAVASINHMNILSLTLMMAEDTDKNTFPLLPIRLLAQAVDLTMRRNLRPALHRNSGTAAKLTRPS